MKLRNLYDISMQHLGFSLGGKLMSKAMYGLMIEKFERKLAIQKCKYFFSWMKNHSLFIYLLTGHSVFIFCIYSVSGERIKKLQRDFPWDKNDGKKKIHLN